MELAEGTFKFACSAREWFAKGDLKVKKEILTAISSNLTLRDKKLCIEAKNPFLILEKSLSRMPEVQARFEPSKFGSTKAHSATFMNEKASKLAWRDAFRTAPWDKIFPYPNVILGQVRQLLSLVE